MHPNASKKFVDIHFFSSGYLTYHAIRSSRGLMVAPLINHTAVSLELDFHRRSDETAAISTFYSTKSLALEGKGTFGHCDYGNPCQAFGLSRWSLWPSVAGEKSKSGSRLHLQRPRRRSRVCTGFRLHFSFRRRAYHTPALSQFTALEAGETLHGAPLRTPHGYLNSSLNISPKVASFCTDIMQTLKAIPSLRNNFSTIMPILWFWTLLITGRLPGLRTGLLYFWVTA